MSTRHFRELDLTLLSEYVSSHGHGSYMPCAIPMAHAMIEAEQRIRELPDEEAA